MPHGAGLGHGYVIRRVTLGTADAKAAQIRAMPPPPGVTVEVVSAMENPATPGNQGDVVITFARVPDPVRGATAHTKLVALANQIDALGGVAQGGLAHHWCCFSDH